MSLSAAPLAITWVDKVIAIHERRAFQNTSLLDQSQQSTLSEWPVERVLVSDYDDTTLVASSASSVLFSNVSSRGESMRESHLKKVVFVQYPIVLHYMWPNNSTCQLEKWGLVAPLVPHLHQVVMRAEERGNWKRFKRAKSFLMWDNEHWYTERQLEKVQNIRNLSRPGNKKVGSACSPLNCRTPSSVRCKHTFHLKRPLNHRFFWIFRGSYQIAFGCPWVIEPDTSVGPSGKKAPILLAVAEGEESLVAHNLRFQTSHLSIPNLYQWKLSQTL